jgi:hypothetical protein
MEGKQQRADKEAIWAVGILRRQDEYIENTIPAGDILDSVVRFDGVSPNSRKLSSHGPR